MTGIISDYHSNNLKKRVVMVTSVVSLNMRRVVETIVNAGYVCIQTTTSRTQDGTYWFESITRTKRIALSKLDIRVERTHAAAREACVQQRRKTLVKFHEEKRLQMARKRARPS